MQNGSENKKEDRINRVIKAIEWAKEKANKAVDLLIKWLKKREEALVETLHELAKVVKNGANGEWSRVERILTWMGDYIRKREWPDIAILGTAVAVIAALIIFIRTS